MKKKPAKLKKQPKAKKAKARKAKPKASPFYAQSKRLGFRLLTGDDEALYTELFTDAKTLEHVCPPLSPERAVDSFRKALAATALMPLKQRITVIVERSSKKPIGIASLKMIDAEKRRAEGGILLKPTAHAQRFAIEGSQALISAAFRRHTIDELSAQVTVGHNAGEKLVNGSGYLRGADIADTNGFGPKTSWSMTRDQWCDNFK